MDWIKQKGGRYVLTIGRFKATINKGRGQFWCVYSELRDGMWHFWFNAKPRETLGEAKNAAQTKLLSVNKLQNDVTTQTPSLPQRKQEYRSKNAEGVNAWWHD